MQPMPPRGRSSGNLADSDPEQGSSSPWAAATFPGQDVQAAAPATFPGQGGSYRQGPAMMSPQAGRYAQMGPPRQAQMIPPGTVSAPMPPPAYVPPPAMPPPQPAPQGGGFVGLNGQTASPQIAAQERQQSAQPVAPATFPGQQPQVTLPTSMQGRQDGQMGGQRPRPSYSGIGQPQMARQSQYRPTPMTSQRPNPLGQMQPQTRKPTPMG